MGWKMHQQIKCLLYLFTSVVLSGAFNIDLRNPGVYTERTLSLKGQPRVTSNQNRGIIVTSPLYIKGPGPYQPQQQNHPPITPKVVTLGDKGEPIRHVAVVAHSDSNDNKWSQFTVCSPVVVTECSGSPYINNESYVITDHSEELPFFQPAFQECTNKTMDLVFLFDGSKSLSQSEFNKNKELIEDIMKKLTNTSINFAAVQFATNVRTVFTFNDYRNGDAPRLLQEEQHMYSLTNTHRALRFVLKEHFENTANNATPEATKVLVLITDGVPSDTDGDGIFKKYDSKNIIRFVIGVKDVALHRSKTMASEPKEKHVFHIESYEGLTGLLENIKIFLEIELSEVFPKDMSLRKLSTVFSKDTLIVGSNTHRGSVQEHQIIGPQMKEDSYLGYSLTVGERNKTGLYFSGAPRYNHTGQVVLYTPTGHTWTPGKKWTPVQRISGDQVGSGFGAELCSMDVDSDGSTDFLLVGAPLFHQPHEEKEGKIYIYRLTDELKLINQLNVTAPAMGRFGTTITSVADLNGDRLRDVVVGAPLENQNQGAVYIYLGDRSRGIRSTYSQKIMGEKIGAELRFFGQSVDGSHDLGEDGLPDLLLGSSGFAVVLKSKPVFTVRTHLSFEPEEISIENITCPSDMDDILPLVTLSVCFEMVELTRSTAGAVTPGMNISYTLNVDAMRQTFRGFFNSTTKSTKSRHLMEKCELRNRETCFNHSIYMLKCVRNIISPISIKLNFSQVDSERADVVLNADSEREASVEVPFERRCRNNDTCIAELEVDFNFTTPTLLVADSSYLSVTITLSNHGEDAYNTGLTMHHPPGLAFSRMTLSQQTKSRPLHICDDHEDRTTCGISLPVYRSGSTATFTSVFHVLKDYEWKDNTPMTIAVNSDNQNSTKGSLTKHIRVQFEIKMSILIPLSFREPITHLNFTAEDSAPKRLTAKYKVDNPGWRAFPVNVTLFFPTKLEHNFEMNNYGVLVGQNITHCKESDTEPDIKSEYCTSERKCKFIVCDCFILNNASAVEFELFGEAQFKDLKQQAANLPFLERFTGSGAMVKFRSFLFVTFDKQKYEFDSQIKKTKGERPGKSSFWDDNYLPMKSSEIQIELIVLPDQMLILITGAGLGLLLLVIVTVIVFRVRCSKKKMRYMVEEQMRTQLGITTSGRLKTESIELKEDKVILIKHGLNTS